MFQDLVSQITHSAERLRLGESVELGSFLMGLRSVGPEHKQLAPVLEQMLTVEMSLVRLESALALGNIGAGAAAQVPALEKLSKDPIVLVAGAGFWALGKIGTAEAIDTLTAALKDGAHDRLSFVAGALELAGARAAGALHSLHRVARDTTIAESDRREIRSVITKIYARIRQEHWRAAIDSGFTDYVPLEGLGMQSSLYSYFAPYTVPLDLTSEGLIHDGRFRFRYNGADSQLGLQIYGKGNGEAIAVLAVDERWYGAYPTNAFESITTAVMHIHGLDPQRTVWIEHYTPQAGLSHTSCSAVVQAFDAERGTLHDPIWGPTEKLAGILRRHGLEP